jgi:hypothetical protein
MTSIEIVSIASSPRIGGSGAEFASSLAHRLVERVTPIAGEVQRRAERRDHGTLDPPRLWMDGPREAEVLALPCADSRTGMRAATCGTPWNTTLLRTM